MPLGRGERQDLLGFSETWYPRYHYGWSELTAVRDGRYKFIAAPRRELYDTQDRSRRAARHRGVEPAGGRRAGARPRRHDAEARGGRDAATAAADRTRGGRTAAVARVRGGDGQPRDAGRPASWRPEGQDRPLQPAQARRARLRRRTARRRDREGPGGPRRRPRGDRGAHDARQHERQGTPVARRDRRVPEGAGDRPGARRRRLEPGAGLSGSRKAR